MYPRIYLAIDNIFALKRWTKPDEWCAIVADLGLKYIEASADNELDPLFMGEAYLADWVKAVKKAQSANGVKVVNCYSGHGTYSTLGLTHTDTRVRRRMMEHWFKPMLRTAAELDAGLGFFTHAYPHAVLQDKAKYDEYTGILEDALVEINKCAGEYGCGKTGIEQMYSPHQYPWRRGDAKALLRKVTEKSGRGFYFTEDIGHHQKKFLKPDEEVLKKLKENGAEEFIASHWFGSDRAYGFAAKGLLDELLDEIAATGYLFADKEDGDCYAWLSELGCYSPIIHLQQTNGAVSSHYPFTEERNAWGIIEGPKLLNALKIAYDKPAEPGMPVRCDKIYLTFELFTGTGAIPREALAAIKKSVLYWRNFIKEDGLLLDELVNSPGGTKR
jgi:sugar phosphate isomerase/epimerase